MRLVYTISLLLLANLAFSQNYSDIDKSPLDLATYKKGGDVIAKVWYGRPSKNDREVFGKLVKYGKVWRTGANENTEIMFTQDVKINDKVIPAGTYSLFSIPNKDEWVVILNSDTDKWGHFFYKEKNDVLRITVPTEETKKPIEAFSISFDKSKDGFYLYMAWDLTQVKLAIETIK